MNPLLSRVCRQGRCGCRSDAGVAGIEIAILMPVILLIFLGFTEVYLYLRTVAAAERVAFTLADTLGQKATVKDIATDASADNIGAYWQAASIVGEPLDMRNLGEVIVTSVCDSDSDNCTTPSAIGTAGRPGAPKLLWQRRSPVTGAQSPNQNSLLATGLAPTGWPFYSGDAMLTVEVFYRFNPFTMTSAVWAGAPGTQIIYEVAYARPRWNKPIQLTAS
jgi:Flp pilus assembly protein TadG